MKKNVPKKKSPKRKKPVKRDGLDRPYSNGEWTSSRFFQFIRTSLRQASARWAPRFKCLANAYAVTKVNKSSGRLAKHYTCAICRNVFPQKEVSVDHIIPVGTLQKFDDLPDFTRKLFCEIDGLRVLCNPCHTEVTNQQKQSPNSKVNPC